MRKETKWEIELRVRRGGKGVGQGRREKSVRSPMQRPS
jgi:hypothetical protein